MNKPIKDHFFPAAVLLSGILAAQALFSALVYSSNISLHQNLQAFRHSGYLIVPNSLVMPGLLNFTPAFCGGIFFALTTGAGLTLITFLAVSVWRRYSGKKLGLVFLFLAAAIFFAVKFDFSFILTSICILTVGAAGVATLKFFPGSGNRGYPFFRAGLSHLAVIILLGFVWMPLMTEDFFISVRDNLLLSNPAGKQINDFYYKYTLYPAEAFKSLDQKLLKSCRIRIKDSNLNQRVRNKLIANDFLPVEEKFSPDLTVVSQGKRLVFLHNGATVYETPVSQFLSGSEKILKLVSEKTDQSRFLRKLTFLSLVAASPMICYIFLHAFFMLILFFVKSETIRFGGACVACIFIFSIPALSAYRPANPVSEPDLIRFLRSDHWQDRVAALKMIANEHLRIEQYIDPESLSDSPLVVERYWLAKTLAASSSTHSSHLLRQLLDDPSPNVVCMAMFSMGKQNRLDTAKEIIHRIETSEHWYVQWYAYKALKRLGWTQKKYIRSL